MKKDKRSRYLNYFGSALFLILLPGLSACNKKTDVGTVDPNSLDRVIADNFNLSIFNAVLKYSRQDKMLQEKGPFTVLAPSDAAFSNIYPSPANVALADKGVLVGIARYHIVDGRFELSKLPFRFNQELPSRGGKLYVTRWVKGTDTVLTINGARVLAKNVAGSNGLIQVMNRVLTPYVHEKLGNALAAEPDITLFYQAVLSAGMLETINSTGPYTILAPNNTAMQALGYATVAQVSNTDPEVLKRLVSFHIIRDRRFVYDYILGSGSDVVIKQNMLDDNSISVSLIADSSQPGGFSGITVKGEGNSSAIQLSKQDILTGNGVLHIINGALRTGF